MHLYDTNKQAWQLVLPNTRGGEVYRKVMVSGESGTGISYDVRLERYGSGEAAYRATRHRHHFEQFRYVLEGELDFGPGSVSSGEIGYFPSNAFYGPQVVDGATALVGQWGDFWVTEEQNRAAVEEMAANGEFDGRVYTYKDRNGRTHKVDPVNAIWEHVFKRRFVPGVGRYSGPIVMNPDGFQWVQTGEGLQSKVLGSFTEFDFSVSAIKAAAGRSHPLAADGRPSFLFATAGAATVGASTFGALCGLWLDERESVVVDVAETLELVRFDFPPRSAVLSPWLADPANDELLATLP